MSNLTDWHLQSVMVLDLTSPSHARSMAEAIVWCGLQPSTPVAEETSEIRNRRAQIKRAVDLLRFARANTREFEEGMRLLREADPESIAPLEKQLRSNVLAPAMALSKVDSEAEREKIVAELVAKRSELLRIQKCEVSESEVLSGSRGRWLAYAPSENVEDGASRYASNGFFGDDDAPPWDTWVLYSDRTLVSWVPDVLVSLAQAGIDGNPVDSINWNDLSR
jgi:hypothetical protein